MSQPGGGCYLGSAGKQLPDECEGRPELLKGGIELGDEFDPPFTGYRNLLCREQRDLARTYLAWLGSDLKHKTAEPIAYSPDRDRHCLRHFVGSSARDQLPPLSEPARSST